MSMGFKVLGFRESDLLGNIDAVRRSIFDELA